MNSKAIKRQLLAAIAMVLVAAIALGSSTYAWFVSNTKVSATSSSVKSTSATPDLLIVQGGTVATPLRTGGKTSESITSAEATALYPASSDDCKNWYAVSGWETGNNGLSLANAYKKLTITSGEDDAAAIKAGTYTQGSSTVNAYQVSNYSVYTTTGDVELNLNPENPISVTVNTAGLKTDAHGFKDALRVGVVVNDTLKFVYAPTAETGTGNDKDAATGYRTVADTSKTKPASYTVLTDSTWNDWIATNNNDGTYTKAKNTLGTVTATGVLVQVYVWLEGTDADCLVGTADVDTDDNSYQVTLNFVGATVDAPKP